MIEHPNPLTEQVPPEDFFLIGMTVNGVPIEWHNPFDPAYCVLYILKQPRSACAVFRYFTLSKMGSLFTLLHWRRLPLRLRLRRLPRRKKS